MGIDRQALLDLLDSKELVSLRKQADTCVFVRADLASHDLPPGLDADTTWKVLTSIRHQTAHVLPFDTYQDIGRVTETWYTLPRCLSTNLKRIEVLCSRGSFIDAALGSIKSSLPVQELLEQELSHAFAIESMDVGPQRIHEAFMGENAQADAVSRIAKNFQGIVFDLAPYESRPVTAGLIEELYYRLIAGAENFKAPQRTSRPYKPLANSRYHDRREVVDAVCTLADLDSDPFLHPVLRAICISWFLWDFEATPSLNALMEVILRHLLFQRWGLPTLRWVPFCDNESHIGPSVYRDALRDCGYGLDSTYLFCKVVEYLISGIRRVESIAVRATELKQELESAFAEEFNPRQHSILLNMILAPELEMKIEPHRKACGITYPTARSDFYDLERRGFLTKVQRGRAFAFRATEKLLATLSARPAPHTRANGPSAHLA